MKVLLTCLSRSWGGLEMYSIQTAKQLINNSIETDLLCYKNSRVQKEAMSEHIPIIISGYRNYFQIPEYFKVSNSIKKNRYDIIHSHVSKDLWLMVPALKISKLSTPLLLTKQMGSYIIKKDFLHKWIYKRVDLALAISKVISKNLVDTTPLTEDKIELLHNSIDTARFNADKVDRNLVRKEFRIKDDELLIGMIARFSPGKGHEEFILAANDILHKHKNVRFMIVGEPSKGEDSYASEIKAMAAGLDILDKIIFTGYRKDTPEVLAALDIFVFPSHAEAFGIALAEALSMGKPSVCSNSDGVLDIAVDNVTSFLFEKKNWVDLKEKLERLIKDENLRHEFGKAARKRAIEMFDLTTFTNKLIGIYKHLLINRSNTKL
jgi:glycosyltransferase involved in cell wall biosynthesis